MLDLLITKLRDKRISREEFRLAANQTSALLAAQTARSFPRNQVQVETPLAVAEGCTLTSSIVLVPILRAGLAMLPSFVQTFPDAKVGFIGLKRDEETALPKKYYENIPQLTGSEQIVLIDPMLATAGSACAAVQALIEAGGNEEQISCVCIIGCPEGVTHFEQQYPKARLIVGTVDDGLNSAKFIVPGVGDFGDRYCGTD